MKKTWRYTGGILALGMALAVAPVQGQRGAQGGAPGRADGAGPHMGRSLEIALEHQNDLGLSSDQVRELEELQGILDNDVAPLAQEMRAIREAFQTGDLDRNQAAREMAAARGRYLTAAAPLQGRVQEILTVDQHQRLQPLVWSRRPGLGSVGPAQGRRGGAVRPGVGRRGAVGRAMGGGGFARGGVLGGARPLVGRRAPRQGGSAWGGRGTGFGSGRGWGLRANPPASGLGMRPWGRGANRPGMGLWRDGGEPSPGPGGDLPV